MDDALLRRLTPSVLGILVRRGADFASAEDAVQDALLEAVRDWPDNPPRDPKGWLVTVAWRRFLDGIRSDAARRKREFLVDEQPGERPVSGSVPGVDDTLQLYFLCAWWKKTFGATRLSRTTSNGRLPSARPAPTAACRRLCLSEFPIARSSRTRSPVQFPASSSTRNLWPRFPSTRSPHRSRRNSRQHRAWTTSSSPSSSGKEQTDGGLRIDG